MMRLDELRALLHRVDVRRPTNLHSKMNHELAKLPHKAVQTSCYEQVHRSQSATWLNQPNMPGGCAHPLSHQHAKSCPCSPSQGRHLRSMRASTRTHPETRGARPTSPGRHQQMPAGVVTVFTGTMKGGHPRACDVPSTTWVHTRKGTQVWGGDRPKFSAHNAQT